MAKHNISDSEREVIMQAWEAFQVAANELETVIRHGMGVNSFDFQRAKAYWLGQLEQMQENRNDYFCTIPESLRMLGVIDSDGEYVPDSDASEDYGNYESKEDCVASGEHLTSCDSDGYCNFCGEQ